MEAKTAIVSLTIFLAVVLIILVSLIIAYKSRYSLENTLINAWKKEHLIPRGVYTRQFAMRYLMEFHPREMNIKGDLYWQFYRKSEDKDFVKNCKYILRKTSHWLDDIHLFIELKGHLSQLIVYRCFYQPIEETKQTIAKHNISIQEMQFDQVADKKFFKKIFQVEAVDSMEFQVTIDSKMNKMSRRNIRNIIDYL